MPDRVVVNECHIQYKFHDGVLKVFVDGNNILEYEWSRRNECERAGVIQSREWISHIPG